MYQVIRNRGAFSSVQRLADGAFIPPSTENGDYREFLLWNSAQPVPLDLSDHAPDPVPADDDKAPLAAVISRMEAGTSSASERNELLLRIAKRLYRGM